MMLVIHMISYSYAHNFISVTGNRNDVESLIGEAREIRDGLFEKQIQIDWQKSKFLRLPQSFRCIHLNGFQSREGGEGEMNLYEINGKAQSLHDSVS